MPHSHTSIPILPYPYFHSHTSIFHPYPIPILPFPYSCSSYSRSHIPSSPIESTPLHSLQCQLSTSHSGRQQKWMAAKPDSWPWECYKGGDYHCLTQRMWVGRLTAILGSQGIRKVWQTLLCPLSLVVSAAVWVNSALTNYTTSARHSLRCKTGFCRTLAQKYDIFASAVCNDVVPGMDIYWISLVFILITSFLTALLSFLLASRFIDLNKKANRSAKFHLTSAIIRQLRAVFWLVLSISIDLWFVVYIRRDDYFHTKYCMDAAATCCATCVWIFGAVFVSLAIAVGGVSHLYQCINVYRIHSESCKGTYHEPL